MLISSINYNFSSQDSTFILFILPHDISATTRCGRIDEASILYRCITDRKNSALRLLRLTQDPSCGKSLEVVWVRDHDHQANTLRPTPRLVSEFTPKTWKKYFGRIKLSISNFDNFFKIQISSTFHWYMISYCRICTSEWKINIFHKKW